MTRRNAGEENTDRRTVEGREAAAREAARNEAVEARNERIEDRGEEMTREDIPDLPQNQELQGEGAQEMTGVQTEGQRKDRVETNVRGGTDVEGATSEQYVGEVGELDSTNALTQKARDVLGVRTHKFTVATGIPIADMTDIKDAIYALVGTTNVKFGKKYTAIKSSTFKFPGGRGMRAAVIHPNGDFTLLQSGADYAQWYNAIQRAEGTGAIFRFDQHIEMKNPFTQADIYELENLPAPGASVEVF